MFYLYAQLNYMITPSVVSLEQSIVVSAPQHSEKGLYWLCSIYWYTQLIAGVVGTALTDSSLVNAVGDMRLPSHGNDSPPEIDSA